ncbi:CDP-diacylglycerol--glycerol-3-phosphate 3-phosphatidyltransferase [Micrococcales bacterium KH10]|nr:CDP-diacylglycerol--glycerol-3-phosphate 3-phosphatidyltransferase [Micrococcales bacterium KH10]
MTTTQQVLRQWNAANAITATRIAVAPVLGVLLVVGGHDVTVRWIAAALFVVIALTDRLDGHLARSRNMVTDLGKILDPIADKLLIGVALCALSGLGEVWWWVTIVVLGREIGITVLRLALIRVQVMPASMGGKIKTTLQVASISLFLFPLWVLPQWVQICALVLFIAAVAVTLLTGIQYTLDAVRLTHERRKTSQDAR